MTSSSVQRPNCQTPTVWVGRGDGQLPLRCQ